MDLFRVRLNCIDHYQATPTRYDPQLRNDILPSQATKEPKVPVIRVFGSTETGQKVCAHIHGAFPYLYVEYTGSLDPEEVGTYIYRLHLSIDHALAVSYRRDERSGNAKFVARITLVKGIPFYGFHVGYRFFLKIYVFNPIVMTRLADLLQQGVIMQRQFQPYEAHLQYLLQFMVDYNLYGCDYLTASKTIFRAPVPVYSEHGNSQHLWHNRSIPQTYVTEDIRLPRVSHCSIEVDICVKDIVNRQMVKERHLHHDFIERLRPLPPGLKLVHSMAGLWKDETRRLKMRMKNFDLGSSPFPAEALVSMSADTRNVSSQGWIHEDEYREEVEKLLAAERSADGKTNPTFDTFVQKDPLEDNIQTALQSVEDLYPENLLPMLGLSLSTAALGQNPASSIEVDEKRILDQDEGDIFPGDSDTEWLLDCKAQDGNSGDDPLESNNLNTTKSNIETDPGAAKSGAARRTSGTVVNEVDFKSAASWLSLGGICRSRLVTGKDPSVPAYDELLAFAQEEGLFTRNQEEPQPVSVARPSSKRLGPAGTLEPAAKRRKQPASERTVTEHRSQDALPICPLSQSSTKRVDPQTATKSRARKGAARGASKSSQNNRTLSFPIVKSQEEPPIKRLFGHKDKQQDSQPRGNDVTTKTVSFSLLPMAESKAPETDPTVMGMLATPLSQSASVESRLNRAKARLGAFSSRRTFLLSVLPPSSLEVSSTLKDFNLPDVISQDAYYSNEKDVPGRPREYAGREFRLESKTIPFLPHFDPTGMSTAGKGVKNDCYPRVLVEGNTDGGLQNLCSYRSWEIAQPPPSFHEVQNWWAKEQQKEKATAAIQSRRTYFGQRYLSQIDGPTPKHKHGFKYSPRKKSTSVKHEAQYMSTMSMEMHVNTRGKFVPNPDHDEVQCIFWSVKADGTISTSQDVAGGVIIGVVVFSPDGTLAERIRRQTSAEVIEETDELGVIVRMVEIVRTHDPDILTGYEVHGSSWGYLIERARVKYDFDLCDEFSRVRTDSHGRIGKENDRWGFNTTSTIRVTGRHMINVWRAMRGELNLLQYTMENVAWHLLHKRIPHYSWETLTDWYKNGRHRDLAKLVRYYLVRTRLDLDILESNELIPRTSEQARLLGVDFFSVFSRGSQFKVESIMFRIAKPENFMLVSPSRKQVGGQNALECLPLVMEPQSDFYSSPLLVLDFQSLYPSVMIAYNICYSTFLGRVVNWRGTNKMGFTEYKRHDRILELLKDHINISPNGMMYLKAEIRKSLLARMLTEILETRVMTKSGMKEDKDDKALQQLLNHRQLALKLLANVTYGYTSASFSGRMPCSEIADSIVQTGRETLEKAIAFIHSQERWGAEVVYGDTDSLFVYLKGRTREQAFDIGHEIAKAITDMNPRPVKLKFEKVYHPCVLLAKKRYVGYKYEGKDQAKPEFDAKGIETVRRDGTPAEQKIEEKALKLLFETADLSQVKEYFQAQCDKIMRGAVSVQDFCFAKEVKLGSYSDRGAPPPGALISARRMLEDARAEPQYGERVPYVVVTGAPGTRLIDRCVAPEELLNDPHSGLDAEYYISKNLIPPLERIFNLVGANVRQWYDEMPKVQRIRRLEHVGGEEAGGDQGSGSGPGPGPGPGPGKKTLESYMKSAWCVVCEVKMRGTEGVLCSRCREDAASSVLALQDRLRCEEQKLRDVVQVCRSCAGLPPLDNVPCDSKDCPVFYSRVKQGARLRASKSVLEPVIRELGANAAREALQW
ncbi:DNA polymerase family B [Sodiomyces alkalinus F11]|uniref:DNA polymerase n=1 Tax=Sodiomyces alkalinus (strain CBS 110278 / VKM F-3762 / F11) TaxID=1314773 RepID=A0A3N2Q4I3_SODAK|nr:DNA polymerase family B [Sodiomyces alkalinus F11]ROT41693.1 DNA polymerase family B [Sodiomyces alkalinus F11]